MNISPQINKTQLLNALSELRAEAQPSLAWGVARYLHVEPGRRCLDFLKHQYQIEILQNTSDNTVVMSSVQSGKSLINVIKMLAACAQGLNVLYVVPTSVIQRRFVHRRVDPMLALVPFYRQLIEDAKASVLERGKAADNMTIKLLGESGSVCFASSRSPESFGEYVSDINIIDELDRCDQDNIALAFDRMGHSEIRREHFTANPTIDSVGIAVKFDESDGREWFIVCEHCGEAQTLNWFGNVVHQVQEKTFAPILIDESLPLNGEAVTCVCAKCARSLDRRKAGEWVAARPDATVAGWHISQLMSGTITLDEMWTEWQKAESNQTLMQNFYNSRLGLPYTAEGSKLTRSALARIVGKHPRIGNTEPCNALQFGGIDVGTMLNVTTMAEGGKVNRIFATPDWSDLDLLMKSNPRLKVVIDAMPERRLSLDFANRYPGRVFICFFNLNETSRAFAIDRKTKTVKTDRTPAMDRMMAALLGGEDHLTLPRSALSVPDYVAQMCAPTRLLDETKKPPRFIWDEGNRADHYAFASLYAVLARDVFTRHNPMVVVG